MFFAIFFLEISSESMATKEAAEINEEAVAPKAPIKEEDVGGPTLGNLIGKTVIWYDFCVHTSCI